MLFCISIQLYETEENSFFYSAINISFNIFFYEYTGKIHLIYTTFLNALNEQRQVQYIYYSISF